MERPRLIRQTMRLCTAFLLVILAATPTVQGAEAIPNPSKECAICHIRWVRAFDRSSPEESNMEQVMERQAGSGDMCLSCHDGSVTDSRFKIWSTSHHTTDSVPSPAVKIPTDRFPLDTQGRMTCATCHTAHAVPDSSDLETVIFLRQPNIDSSLCLSCHPEHAHKNDFQHPLGYSESPVPAVILEAGGKATADGHGIICQTCHEPHGARNAWMLVLPPSELCVACHTQKSPEAAAPAGAPVHHIGHTYPGFEPPATLLDEKATFGPDGELSCLSCHRLHDASGAKPLLIRKNEGSSLCLDCHREEETVLGSSHDLRLSSPETANAKGQEARVSGPCGACHRIHGWARHVPDTGRPHSSGCMECHQTGGPAASHRPYVEGHPVGVPAPEHLSVALPLDAETKTIGCLTCHDPHTPLAVEATTVEDPNSHVQPPRSFLRAEGSRLCAFCHDKVAEAMSGPHDPAGFDPAVREALAVHPSIGSCRLCHTTHKAKGPHLWTRAPADSSAGPVSSLCGACHDENLVSKPLGTHHPLASVSSLEGVSDSLHHNTMAQSRAEGEVGCTTCHDPHDGSDAAQRHKAAASLCADCHTDKRGVIGSVHDPGANDWGKDLDLVSKSVCVDCHPIHGPKDQSALRLALGPADADQQLCEVCHRFGSPGQAMKTPHMGEVVMGHVGSTSQELPLASGQAIACSTCHDIHQAMQPSKLLRSQRKESVLCLACHPEASGLLGSSHDLRISAPGEANAQGETADESGPCGVCHSIHSQPYGNGNWAHSAISGRDSGTAYCTGCHQQDACAADHVPARADHPDVPILNRTQAEDPNYMPTFNRSGQHARNGAISCLTCHEPHAVSSAHQTGQVQGSLAHKFLRPTAHQSLCVDCHGIETLWRFLYYHRTNRNPHPKRDFNQLQQSADGSKRR